MADQAIISPSRPREWQRFRYPRSLYRWGGMLLALCFLCYSIVYLNIPLERFIGMFGRVGALGREGRLTLGRLFGLDGRLTLGRVGALGRDGRLTLGRLFGRVGRFTPGRLFGRVGRFTLGRLFGRVGRFTPGRLFGCEGRLTLGRLFGRVGRLTPGLDG